VVKRLLVILLVVLSANLSIVIYADDSSDTWMQIHKYIPTDGFASEYFGWSVSISGDTAVFGAVGDNPHGELSGSVYVISRNQGGTSNWGLVTKLSAADGEAFDYFGESVAISGDTIVVGASGDDDKGSSSGSAYIFDRNQGGLEQWGQVAKLVAADGAAADFFGEKLSLSGDYIAVGAYGDDDHGLNSGSVYVFERNQGGAGNWGQAAKLTPPDGANYDEFGRAVSIDGDTIIAGAHNDADKGTYSGSAYVYARNQGSAWVQVTKLLAADGAASDYFGESVSVSGDSIVVGAYGDDDKGSGSGSAYVFERNQGGLNHWGQIAKLIAADGAASDFFGSQVSVSGDSIVVGAYGDDDKGSSSGSAYVFERNQGGLNHWGQIAKLTPAGGSEHDEFGRVVYINGSSIVVGVYNDTEYGLYSGAAYIFRLDMVVTFPDSNLESVVRSALYKPSGDIYHSELSTMASLIASGKGISNLAGLQYCANLATLDLGSNEISDISTITGLSNLQWLNLNDNLISDISFLTDLPDLQFLYLTNNQISDISVLLNLNSLISLDIGSNQISNISPLSSLSNLRWLVLKNNRINDISPLADLTNLSWLNLEKNLLKDITPLQDLTDMEWLVLNHNQINNISALSGLINLQWIGLSNNKIDNISALTANRGLGNGDSLYLGYNFLILDAGSEDMVDIQTLESRGILVYYMPQHLRGDANQDGVIKIDDVMNTELMMLQIIEENNEADANLDGKLTIADILAIEYIMIGYD
jgi:hypothetical protein